MKKFYSIIAVASLMLTSVLSFTSCQKDEMPMPAKTQTVTTNNNGDNGNGQSVVVTSTTSQYDGNGTIFNTGTKESSSYEADPFTSMGGTWEYVDAEGTKCTLELSNERKTSGTYKTERDGKKYALNILYDAKLTVGEKTIEGRFYTGIFTPKADNVSYCITIQKYMSSLSANSFNADIKVDGKLTAQGITLSKTK